MSKKLLFLGTPDFSVPSLEKILDVFSDAHIDVISMPDKVRGRGKSVSASPVKRCALDNNKTVSTPHTKSELTKQINSISPDIIIVVAYGMIIEKSIVDQYLCINVHASLLPKYRGASPIQTALLNGDHVTGITLIKLNEAMDSGDILSSESLEISSVDNHGSLEEKLAHLGAELLINFLINYFKTGQLELKKQINDDASYCKKISKSDLIVDQSMNALEIYHRIRAFSPRPGAVYFESGKRIKLLEAELTDGRLKLIKIQPEGKPVMLYSDYLLGHPKGVNLHDY